MLSYTEDFMDHDPKDLLAILKALMSNGDIDSIIGEACCDLAANFELDTIALAGLDAIIRSGIETRITADLTATQRDWGVVVTSIDASHLTAPHSVEVFDALDRLLEPSTLRVIADDVLTYMSPLPVAVVSMELGAMFASAITETDDPDVWLQEIHAETSALCVNSYPEGHLAVAVLAAAAHESLSMLRLDPESLNELHEWIDGICPDVDFHVERDDESVSILSLIANSTGQPLRRVLLIAAAVHGVLRNATPTGASDDNACDTCKAEALINEALTDNSALLPRHDLADADEATHEEHRQIVEWIEAQRYAWAVLLRFYTGINTAPNGEPMNATSVIQSEAVFCTSGPWNGEYLHPMVPPLIWGAHTFLTGPDTSPAQLLRLADESLERIHAMDPEVADPALAADALAAIVHFTASKDSPLAEEQRELLRQWAQVFSSVDFDPERFGDELQVVAQAHNVEEGKAVAAAACAHVALFGFIPNFPRSTADS